MKYLKFKVVTYFTVFDKNWVLQKGTSFQGFFGIHFF